jgi:hypothetical protein
MKTTWEAVAGKRIRLERCTTREIIRALAVAVFREGIMRGQGRACLGPSDG